MAQSASHSDTGEPTAVLFELAQSNTSLRPSQPERRSGRLVSTERQKGDRYPQAEDFGWKPTVYAQKPADPTLQELREKLNEVEQTLTQAAELFEAEKDHPNTKVVELEAEVARLTSLLAQKQQALNAAKAEGNAFDRVSRSIDKAEKSVSGLAGATIATATSVDCERVFQVASKFVPKGSLDGLRVRHDLALRHLRPEHFIQLSGKTLGNAEVERHGARVMDAIKCVATYLKKLLAEKVI